MKIDFNDIQPSVLQNFQGGQGQLVSRRYQDGNNKIGFALLTPGSSIGMHAHVTSSEIIFVISGEGKMTLGDGSVETLRAGDCHYCPKGGSHSLANEGTEDLIFRAVVPEHK